MNAISRIKKFIDDNVGIKNHYVRNHQTPGMAYYGPMTKAQAERIKASSSGEVTIYCFRNTAKYLERSIK